MWEAEHYPECSDQDRYEVVRKMLAIEDKNGSVLDANPKLGEVAEANCADCGAPAHWKE